ncbi:MAG: hypothetical protein LBB38_01290 [Puniceicoccales bacterium]|jgi:hypothetical protein|nr:hypothetical protein [Puniceicoccales bacterium]
MAELLPDCYGGRPENNQLDAMANKAVRDGSAATRLNTLKLVASIAVPIAFCVMFLASFALVEVSIAAFLILFFIGAAGASTAWMIRLSMERYSVISMLENNQKAALFTNAHVGKYETLCGLCGGDEGFEKANQSWTEMIEALNKLLEGDPTLKNLAELYRLKVDLERQVDENRGVGDSKLYARLESAENEIDMFEGKWPLHAQAFKTIFLLEKVVFDKSTNARSAALPLAMFTGVAEVRMQDYDQYYDYDNHRWVRVFRDNTCWSAALDQAKKAFNGFGLLWEQVEKTDTSRGLEH